ncbi:hypothetical protein MUGA111182_19265 [Mucilaginibacter galii]|uniref:Uncharacterized protein n=1 Tax=Mucilaginibacter galii TaxID=2005073 RepID=A0A917JBU6_9SPHI|nr:hypothetical protein [Mucilaginibacter galii]GGI52763.1 hypothetical protein GCM10011425_39750 [Mucilaginibacter galii]
MKLYFILFAIILITSSCDVDTNSSSTEEDEETNWKYDKTEDRMTSDTVYFATTYSDDRLYFGYYRKSENAVSPELTIRKKNNVNEVMVSVTHPLKSNYNGRFYTDDDEISIRVRFDSQKPEEYTCSGTEGGSGGIVFIDSATTFITKLKKSKKLLIEAEFIANSAGEVITNHRDKSIVAIPPAGNKTEIMEFDIAGLEW